MQLRKCNGCGEEKPLNEFSPHRSSCKPCGAAATKRYRQRNLEQSRAKARDYMRKLRSTPEGAEMLRARERAQYRKNPGAQRTYLADLKKTDFFRWKARRSYIWLTAVELRRLWEQQGGRCALSGRALDDTAELDHKVPRSRGGLDTYENAQWLAAAVNQAKRNLLDEEFVALCSDIIAHQRRRRRTAA